MSSQPPTLNNLSISSESSTSIGKSPALNDFFVTTPELRRSLKGYLVAISRGTLLIVCVIFTYLSIYWGALWKSTSHAHNVKAWVVDFDGGIVGKAVTDAVLAYQPAPTRMTWIVKDVSEFPGGPEQLADVVHDQKIWIGVAINAGTSKALEAAIASPETRATYNASLAITGYGEEARNENAFRSTVRPQFDAFMQNVSAQFAAQFMAQNISTLPQEQWTSIATTVPHLITRPIYFTLNNMRPFDVPVATAVTFVGMIYLVILAFMVTAISGAARQFSGLEAKLNTPQVVALRLLTNFAMYFVLSLFYSLLCLAFATPFIRYYGKAGFVINWMLQWVGMLALGLALEVMVTLLTTGFISFFLVFWIIVNVSPTFLPFDLLPGVYKYGYAMPFLNISKGVRTLIFGVKNELGLNFGILIAWAVLSCCTLTLVTMYDRRSKPQPTAPLKPVEKVEVPMTATA